LLLRHEMKPVSIIKEKGKILKKFFMIFGWVFLFRIILRFVI
jgi:hypothetical protein